jgi:Xaa-Pro aminopeptidase
VSTRLAAARGVLEHLGLDGILVSDAYDVRYLCGFRGEDAMLVVGRTTALICTDSRYWAQVAEEVEGFALERTEALVRDSTAAAARELGERAALGFQGGTLTHADYRLLRRRHRGRLRDVGDKLSRLRGLKEPAEIEAVRRAAAMTDAALEAVVAGGLVGRTEAEIAWQIREELHRRGAEGPSFDTVVAAGPRGALAHAIPGQRRIVAGDLVVVDSGARVDGYCSDITRTFAAGELSDELRRVYAIVLAAQLVAVEALRPGVTGHAADKVARDVIEAAGYGDAFGHGTGHGVGLEIHEYPRLGRRSRDVLAPGMLFTVEPGIYLQDVGGVRIEDTVVLGEDGCRLLTLFPKELVTVG